MAVMAGPVPAATRSGPQRGGSGGVGSRRRQRAGGPGPGQRGLGSSCGLQEAGSAGQALLVAAAVVPQEELLRPRGVCTREGHSDHLHPPRGPP